MSNVKTPEPAPAPLKKVLTTEQACVYLGDIHRSTLDRLAKRHGVRKIKSGRAGGNGLTRWAIAELDRLLAKMTRVAR